VMGTGPTRAVPTGDALQAKPTIGTDSSCSSYHIRWIVGRNVRRAARFGLRGVTLLQDRSRPSEAMSVNPQPGERAREQAAFDDNEAAWIAAARRPFADHVVASLVPAAFERYARLLHPAWAAPDMPVQWATVAAWSGPYGARARAVECAFSTVGYLRGGPPVRLASRNRGPARSSTLRPSSPP